MPQRFFKQSPALEDYDFDWSGWLVDGDFITGFTVTADDGVTLGDVLHQQGSPVIKQFVGGGTHGNSYKVTCSIRTDQGRADVAQVIILIRDIGTGGQPVAPPLEEEDEMTIVTEISQQVSFPQAGVNYHLDKNNVIILKTGQLVTMSWSFIFDLTVGTLNYIEMVLPIGFQGKDGVYVAGNYAYEMLPVGSPDTANAPQQPANAYLEPAKTGTDRIAFYPHDWTTFPAGNIYYFAGQMTYLAQ